MSSSKKKKKSSESGELLSEVSDISDSELYEVTRDFGVSDHLEDVVDRAGDLVEDELCKPSMVPIIRGSSSGNYNLQDKSICIMFMEYTSGKDKEGGYSPRFNLCSDALGVRVPLLESWWKNRESITRACGSSVDYMDKMASTKLKFMMMSSLDEISRRGLENMTNSELLKFMKESIMLSRLLDGKSTSTSAVGILGLDSHVGK